MKGAGCLFTIFVVLAVLSLALLFVLSRYRPESLHSDPHPKPPPQIPPEPVPDPDAYARRSGELREFSSSETEEAFKLHYGFVDYNREVHRIECSVSRADHDRETASFGYVWADLKKEIDRQAQEALDREVDRRGIREYMTVTAWDGGGYQWKTHYPPGMDPDAYAMALVRVQEMLLYIRDQYPKVVDRIRAQLYLERGFILKGSNTLVIDHGSIVLRNQLPLSDCYGALWKSGRGYNEGQYLGLFLAFFQEITYELPPERIHGKYVQGLYVPTEVLIHDHGDCDSKSLAFAAMMRSMMKPTLVIDLPKHVLVAVESRPGPGQSYVRLGNRYFVLCEVAGPAKLPPGDTGQDNGESGYFDYTLIEPTSSDLRRDSSREGARPWE